MSFSPKETFDAIVNKFDTLDNICSHVANGGSLIDLCAMWNVRYSDVITWINADQKRKKLYNDCIEARGEWYVQRILKEILDMGTVDFKEAFNPDGSLKAPSKIPSAITKCINSIDFVDLPDGGGVLKKMKFESKLKALEMLGKHKFMFVERKIVLNGNNDDKKFRDEFFGLGSDDVKQETGGSEL